MEGPEGPRGSGLLAGPLAPIIIRNDSQRGICGSLSLTTPVSRRRRRTPVPNLLISLITLGPSAGLNFTYRAVFACDIQTSQ
jgi:hypothetical protein